MGLGGSARGYGATRALWDFRMMASSPGNSGLRGMRTALFRPFLKTLTWRSGLVLAGFDGICQALAKGSHLSTSQGNGGTHARR